MKSQGLRNLYVLCTLLLGTYAMASAAASSTEVTVVPKSGAQDVVSVDSSGVIYFKDNTMFILSSTSADKTYSYALSEVRKVTFKQNTVVVRVLSEGQYLIYPSPATSVINIANAPDNLGNIQIYSAKGQLVVSTVYVAGRSIDVSGLAAGLYVLKANGVTLKFEKK